MTKTDTYLILRTCNEVYEQNKKLDKIAEQLEVQTRLQEGILRQLYLLCQIAATPFDHVKANMANSSMEALLTVRRGEHSVQMENKR